MGPKRDWKDARAKVESEECCRVCKTTEAKLEAAHVTERRYDQPKPGRKELWVAAESIVPLCSSCHKEYDAHCLDIVHVLETDEQEKALRDTGSLIAALRRTAPEWMRANEGGRE